MKYTVFDHDDPDGIEVEVNQQELVIEMTVPVTNPNIGKLVEDEEEINEPDKEHQKYGDMQDVIDEF